MRRSAGPWRAGRRFRACRNWRAPRRAGRGRRSARPGAGRPSTAARRSPAPSHRASVATSPAMRGSSTACFAAVFQGFDAPGAHRARRRCCRRTGAAGRRACRRRPARRGRRCCPSRAASRSEASKTHLLSRTSSARYSQRSCVAASSRRPSPPGPATRTRLRASVSHSSARPSMSGAPDSTTGVMSRGSLPARSPAANRRGTAVPGGP